MTGYLLISFGLGFCLVLSFVFSGMEAGVFALNRLRVRRLARAGNAQAKILHDFLEKPEKFLWTILVGNTLVNFLILGWTLSELHERLSGHPVMIVLLFTLCVFLFYSYSDLLPKMLFRSYPNRLCLLAANPIRLTALVLAPLVFLLEGISQLALRWRGSQVSTGRIFGNREEMRAVMVEAAQALTGEEHAMVNRVLDLQHFTVAQIIKPLTKTIAVERTQPLKNALALARQENLSRLPVWELRGGQRRIAGLLDVSSLLFVEKLDPNKPAGVFMLPALFLDENTRLEVALRRMQRAGQQLAVVLARDGSEAGVVSLEDILKLMFGEVRL